MNKIKKLKPTDKQKKVVGSYIVLTLVCFAVMFLFFNCKIENGSESAKFIVKTFKYGIDNQYWSYPPIEGLNVDFGSGQDLLWTKTTNAQGTVSFGSGLPDGSYWLEWSYGGEPYREDVTINCSKLVWEYENVLPAKDLGEKISICLNQ